MGQIQVNDGSIYYEIRGSGYPLILIAGFTCDHTLWTPIIDSLTTCFQIVLFDNRGAGRTQDSAKKLSVELLAEDVKVLAKTLGLKKPHIIGQSMGGTIAQKFAATYPEEIGKLGLIVTSAKWRKAMLLGLKSHLFLRQEGVNANVVFESIIPWIFGEKLLEDHANIEMLRKVFFENPYPQSIENHARQMVILEDFDGRADLDKIKAPTLIMYGKEDIVAPSYEAEFLAKHISHAKIEAFEGGHGIILEDSEKLSAAILSFFKSG